MAQVEGSGAAAEREGRVEGWGWRAPDDVRADAQPVGIEELIAGPALQVGGGGNGVFGADSQKKSPLVATST